MVLSVDEKSKAQALQRSQPALPMMPGTPERRSHGCAHVAHDCHARMEVEQAHQQGSGRYVGFLGNLPQCRSRASRLPVGTSSGKRLYRWVYYGA